jgi:hypothetical protein
MLRDQFTLTPGYSESARRLLDDLYRALQIDDQWSVRERERFTWWADNLAQRVSIDPICAANGLPMVSVRIETDVLRGVADTEEAASFLGLLNYLASLSAWVWDKRRGEVKLTCSLWCEARNADRLKDLLAWAMALQCADAHATAPHAAQLLGCEVDASHHPVNGPRPAPDDMLGVRALLATDEGADANCLPKEEFARAAEYLRINFLATHGDDGLTAEFPFWGGMPMMVQWALGRNPARRETSLLEVLSRQSHPCLGSGLLLLLRLPVDADRRFGAEVSRRLNAAEAAEWHPFSTLGAWCWDPHCAVVAFVSFVPARVGALGKLIWLVDNMRVRSAWAHEFVTEVLGIEAKAPESPASFEERTG